MINKKDPLAEELLKIVRKIKAKTKLHEVKGTYRMRAWMVPAKKNDKDSSADLFGRQGR